MLVLKDALHLVQTYLHSLVVFRYKLSVKNKNQGGALVQWLWVTTHVRKVVGSNPSAIYWMDIFHIDLLKNYIVCLKRPKINKKEAGVGPFLKECRTQLYKQILAQSSYAMLKLSTLIGCSKSHDYFQRIRVHYFSLAQLCYA